MITELPIGLVISHLGQGIAVEIADKIYLCQSRRRLETVAVGDRVYVKLINDQQGCIEAILPRRSLLLRPQRGSQTRPVAANIDQVLIVVAIEPRCDFLLIDQYLAVCEYSHIKVGIILNKIDLTISESLLTELKNYQQLNYPIYQISVNHTIGLDHLRATFYQQISLLTGQSGVGKSSLTNWLIGDQLQKIAAVSAISKKGRHTTTAATLYHLAEGGDLIDSPGLSIFGLAELNATELAWGYREFQPFISHCQFHNCQHVKDKGCAIRRAVEQHYVSEMRYQRFLKLREKCL